MLSPSEQRFDVELNCLSNVRLRFFHGVTLSEASGQGWNGCHVPSFRCGFIEHGIGQRLSRGTRDMSRFEAGSRLESKVSFDATPLLRADFAPRVIMVV